MSITSVNRMYHQNESLLTHPFKELHHPGPLDFIVSSNTLYYFSFNIPHVYVDSKSCNPPLHSFLVFLWTSLPWHTLYMHKNFKYTTRILEPCLSAISVRKWSYPPILTSPTSSIELIIETRAMKIMLFIIWHERKWGYYIMRSNTIGEAVNIDYGR